MSKNYNVDDTFMKMFYSCFMESLPTFSFVCWYGLGLDDYGKNHNHDYFD